MSRGYVIVDPCQSNLDSAAAALNSMSLGSEAIHTYTSIFEAQKEIQKGDVIICHFFGPSLSEDVSLLDKNPDYLMGLCFSQAVGFPSGFFYAYQALRAGAKAALVLSDVTRLKNTNLDTGNLLIPLVNSQEREHIYSLNVGEGRMFLLDDQTFVGKSGWRIWDLTLRWIMDRVRNV